MEQQIEIPLNRCDPTELDCIFGHRLPVRVRIINLWFSSSESRHTTVITEKGHPIQWVAFKFLFGWQLELRSRLPGYDSRRRAFSRTILRGLEAELLLPALVRDLHGDG